MSTTRSRRPLFVVVVAAAALVLAACGGDDGDDTAESADRPTTTAATTSAPAGDDAPLSGWEATPQGLTAEVGTTHEIDCPADGEPHTVWGAGTYTDDSSVCTAAVQSGLITFDEGGEVTFELAPGLDEYEAGTANGVTSLRFGTWDRSFTFPDAPPGSVDFAVGPESWNVNLTDRRGGDGERFTYACSPGGTPGSVWGSDPYTDDSSVCTAAVHAGLITVADGGTVVAEVAPGAESYRGSEANGITSNDFGPYSGSFTFPDDQPAG